MKLPVAAKFVDKATGRNVKGWIRATALADIHAQAGWKYPREAQDAHWKWAEIWLPSVTSPGEFESYAASVGPELHALMSVDLRGHDSSGGQALVVEYLATSPVDRIEGRGFKYLGVALVAVAVQRSIELGLEGRLWLESLPDLKTKTFYANIGMTLLPEKSREGFDVFVFETERAMEFLMTAKAESWIVLK